MLSILGFLRENYEFWKIIHKNKKTFVILFLAWKIKYDVFKYQVSQQVLDRNSAKNR